MKIFILLLLVSLVASKKPTVHLIPHGEKRLDASYGLSAEGHARAQCLREVFGHASRYNIGFIVVQKHKHKPKIEKLSFDTVAPLAKDLKLKIRDSCPRKIPGCVVDAVYNYLGDGDVLICWEHKLLAKVAETLGVRQAWRYPSNKFDLIWTLSRNHKYIKNETSQQCPGLDVPWSNLDLGDDALE